MKKKILNVGLIIIMLILAMFTLAGCGNEEKNNSNSKLKAKDEVSGYSYIEETDKSLLDLKKDGTFKYYRDKEELDDNYYEGTYKIYQGKDAIEYVTKDLSNYGVTKTELEELFERNSKYSEDNFYCMILTNDKCIMNGKNVQTEPNDAPYYGFYLENKVLSVVNMKSANKYNFVNKDIYTSEEKQNTTTENKTDNNISNSHNVTNSVSQNTTNTNSINSSEISSSNKNQKVGNSEFGYITIPSNWTKFYDPDAPKTLQYSFGASYIVTLYAVDTKELSADAYAQSTAYGMKQENAQNVTGATVTIGKYTAYQVYGKYSDGKWLVCWHFEAEDGKTHYISVEGADASSEYFKIPETFSLS